MASNSAHRGRKQAGECSVPQAAEVQSPLAVPGSDRFMPIREVVSLTGLSRTTIWRETKAGRFPKPIPLTTQRSGRLESEVRAWMASRLQEARA
jgi:prophage regulatory protein